ncbi:hypothetical protein K437DRAFT_265115 [Tilletiaria anomala UBC 951]|uniref:Uncharacterized protein n=1 Tax=Tilletiaria anomala (strain ATCC 24038 / CBS 436.72 / UBC 951) TaxID=1037660 RepID=A0A066VAB0_TILAU|nr:uncharacterized protein K437DRAFT_265115 [Tilletiaria anomala UBC 951]KDN37228.1 hypothetical protein K437DRAFT_265115 [Tilletiaria anomala UBC 951]
MASSLERGSSLRVTLLNIEVRSFEDGCLRAHLNLSEGDIKLAPVSLQVQGDRDPVVREASLLKGVARDAASGWYSSGRQFKGATRILSTGIPATGAHVNPRHMSSRKDKDEIGDGSEGEDDKTRGSTKASLIVSIAASNMWMTLLISDGKLRLICLADATRTWATALLPFVPWCLECFGNTTNQPYAFESDEEMSATSG